jgi:hypothetical protein
VAPANRRAFPTGLKTTSDPFALPLCSSHVHQTPEEAELAAIRRSNETGLPYGGRGWVDHLCRQLKLDLTIRPRGRPPKAVQYDK